jgi:hypothetical protein
MWGNVLFGNPLCIEVWHFIFLLCCDFKINGNQNFLYENIMSELQLSVICLQESYERAKNILKTHQREHKMLAEALLKYETLDAEDIKLIMAGKETADKTEPV